MRNTYRHALILTVLALLAALLVWPSDKSPLGATGDLTGEQPMSATQVDGRPGSIGDQSLKEERPNTANDTKGWFEVANPFAEQTTHDKDGCPLQEGDVRAMCLKGKELDKAGKIACPQTDEEERRKCMVKFIFG